MIPISSPDATTLGENPIDQLEMASGGNYVYGAYSGTITNWLQWRIGLPESWDHGAVNATIAWVSPSADTGKDVKWTLYAAASSLGDSLNNTVALKWSVTGTVVGGGMGPYIEQTATEAVTLTAGTGHNFLIELRRDWAAETSSPTYVRLLWIKLEYANA
jgi:hypothetical protein